jgi:hypothetical protein
MNPFIVSGGGLPHRPDQVRRGFRDGTKYRQKLLRNFKPAANLLSAQSFAPGVNPGAVSLHT